MSRDDQRDDVALVVASAAGDVAAFHELVDRHRDRLWAVALRTTGDPDDASDALQEALVSAYRRAGTFRAEAQVTTWLHRIIVNACLDLLRRRRSRPTEPLPEEEDRYARLADPTTSTEESAEVSELRADVWAALRTLPAEQRAALVLVDMEGYPVDEAAQILGCAPGTVKSRCSRGRVRLIPLLTSYRRNRAEAADVQPSSPEASAGPSPAGERTST